MRERGGGRAKRSKGEGAHVEAHLHTSGEPARCVGRGELAGAAVGGEESVTGIRRWLLESDWQMAGAGGSARAW